MKNITKYRSFSKQFGDLLDIIGMGGCIAGSYALWMIDFSAEWEPSDIDIFTYNDYAFVTLEDSIVMLGYDEVARTGNSVTYKHPDYTLKVQLVLPLAYRETPEKVIARFDVGLSQVCFVNPTGRKVECLATEVALNDLDNREITMHNTVDALVDLTRVIKYAVKGYKYRHRVLLEILKDDKLNKKYEGKEEVIEYP